MKSRLACLLFGLTLSACATLPPPSTSGFPEGTQFMLNEPYSYRIGKTQETLTIPAGFVTDYASIPAIFRGIFERQGRYSRAALVHDYLYATGACSRKQSDNIFMIAMKESRVSKLTRGAIYGGVRVGGNAAWDGNADDRRAERPRIVPDDYRDIDQDWPDVRALLIDRGVKDPPHRIPASVCRLGDGTVVPE